MWLFWITIVFSLVYLVLYPGLGKIPGVLGWTSASAYAKEAARDGCQDQAALRQVPGDGPEGGRRRSAGEGDGRTAVPQLLRAVPRLRCARQPRLPQPRRHRLAVRRRPGDRSRVDHQRPHGRHAAARAGARRREGEERRRLRALAVGPAERRPEGAARQGGVHAELRRLPRSRRQGHAGDGRAEPDRQDLALRQLRGDDHPGRQQGAPRRPRRRAEADARAQGLRSAPARSRSSPRTCGACRTAASPQPAAHSRAAASADRRAAAAPVVPRAARGGCGTSDAVTDSPPRPRSRRPRSIP